MENINSYIYQLQGKDLMDGTLKIKDTKKYKASFDYSLDAIELNDVALEIGNNEFIYKDKKQYTHAIVSVQFDYSLKKWRESNIGKQKVYTLGKITKLEQREFINGYSVGLKKDGSGKENKIIAIKVDEEFEFNGDVKYLEQFKEKGITFRVDGNKILWKVDKSRLETEKTTSDIRYKLYKEGFKLNFGKNVQEFVRYKRSSGSSRVGKCLFINKKYYDIMKKWSYMGIDEKEITQQELDNMTEEERNQYQIDLASLEAYISLTTSSIIDTIKIRSDQILVIDDYESTFNTTAMATKIKKEIVDGVEKDVLYTEKDDISVTNSIWDGECLLDESLFIENGYEDKGMLLLRHRLAKTCGFNCGIQRFFEDNNITEISQLNGYTRAKSVKDIKMITTPSSLKYLKFGSIDKYFDNMTDVWGVVKYDKPTHYFEGNLVQSHYQLLNTLQFTEEKMREFLTPTFEYIKKLRDNPAVIRHRLKMQRLSDGNNINDTNDFIYYMLERNNDFARTDTYVKFREDVVENFINNVRKGHVLIHGNYSVLCGNGMEMLKYSCNLWDEKPILGIDEVYNRRFEFGEKLLGCRSPHITMSNVWTMKNKYNEEYEKYFKQSKTILHINSIGNNVLETLSGCDFDSDQIIVTNDKILIELAEKNKNNFLVSTNKTVSKKAVRYNTPEQKADLDIKTSENLIGEIVNLSQELNSKIWDTLYKNENVFDETVQELYRDVCQLNVMSCIEIDKAKKEFTIDNKYELDLIRNKWKETSVVYSKKYKVRKDNGKIATQLDIDDKRIKVVDNVVNYTEEEYNSILDDLNNKLLDAKSQRSIDILSKKIEDLSEYEEKIVKKRPKFFSVVGQGKNYDFVKYHTSMDILEELADKMTFEYSAKRRVGNNKKIEMHDLFVKDNFNVNNADRKQINLIKKECQKMKKEICDIYNNDELQNKYDLICSVKQRSKDYISSLNISTITLKAIINRLSKGKKTLRNKKNNKDSDRINEIKEEMKIERFMLSILFTTHKKEFLSLINKNNQDAYIYVVNEDSPTDFMYGIGYKNEKMA